MGTLNHTHSLTHPRPLLVERGALGVVRLGAHRLPGYATASARTAELARGRHLSAARRALQTASGRARPTAAVNALKASPCP